MISRRNLGGPVVRNRVWFFTGYQYLRDYDSQPGTDPSFPRTYEQNKIFGKVTWRIKPSLQLVSSINDEHWVNPQIPTFVTPYEATVRLHAHVPTMTFGNLTHTLSPNTFWDLRVGRFVFSQKNDPSTGDFGIANRFDRVTGVSSGAPAEIGEVTLIRNTVKATLTHFQPQWLGGDHQWKVGTQIEKGGHDVTQIIPTGVRFVDNNGQPFQTVSRDPAISGGQFVTFALFATDTATLGDRLTINAGVRYDHNRAYTQDLPAIDLDGARNGRHHPGTWDDVHVEPDLTPPGCHDQAHRRRANDLARQLRTVPPGHPDGGSRSDSPGYHPRYDHGVRCSDGRLHPSRFRGRFHAQRAGRSPHACAADG